MSAESYRLLLDAIEYRRHAHSTLRSGLPGRVIAFRAYMRRAISKWRQFSEIRRAGQ
jgi:hypothetical protein